MKNNTVIKRIVILISAVLYFAFCFDISIGSIKAPSFVILVAITAALLILFRKNIPDLSVFCIMLSGMALKLAYVIYTPVWCRQHDVIDFGAGEGHAAYMEYILSHKALFDFDPRSVWAFFQPPLHHMISAVWMWVNIILGLDENHMHKNVQILPLCYMCVLMFITYLICRQLSMSKKGRIVTLLLTSFHPIYIMMSASLNNDALSVMLSVLAIYVAILWYLYPTTGKIILLALAIGFAMCAKLSSALVAPPIAAMMIYKTVTDTNRFKDKPKFISYILEFLAFAVIVFPLGLWWPIRNKILFDMPVNYIPEVGEHLESAGMTSVLFDLRTASPFLYMKANGFAYDEYNFVLAAIKSSLFGEGDYAKLPWYVTAVGFVLFALAVIVLIMQIIAMIRTFFVKEASPDKGIRILLFVAVITFIAGFVAFALSGMNLSAMDPRYCAAVVSFLSVFCGIWYDRLAAKGKRAIRAIVMTTSVSFAAVSALFYILVGALQ